jgi:hypothetical protein
VFRAVEMFSHPKSGQVSARVRKQLIRGSGQCNAFWVVIARVARSQLVYVVLFHSAMVINEVRVTVRVLVSIITQETRFTTLHKSRTLPITLSTNHRESRGHDLTS